MCPPGHRVQRAHSQLQLAPCALPVRLKSGCPSNAAQDTPCSVPSLQSFRPSDRSELTSLTIQNSCPSDHSELKSPRPLRAHVSPTVQSSHLSGCSELTSFRSFRAQRDGYHHDWRPVPLESEGQHLWPARGGSRKTACLSGLST